MKFLYEKDLEIKVIVEKEDFEEIADDFYKLYHGEVKPT